MRCIKYFALFTGIQIVLLAAFDRFSIPGFSRGVNDAVVEFWAGLGETILPSGPGGHAMPMGAMLGLFVGAALHAFLPGGAFCYFKNRSARRSRQ